MRNAATKAHKVCSDFAGEAEAEAAEMGGGTAVLQGLLRRERDMA